MLAAIGCLGIIAGPATTLLVESGQRRFVAESASDVRRRLGELNARLARIEAALTAAR
jgi:hypothetical protein